MPTFGYDMPAEYACVQQNVTLCQIEAQALWKQSLYIVAGIHKAFTSPSQGFPAASLPLHRQMKRL